MDQNISLILHQKYNPEGSQLRKAQLRMLEMMKFVDAVCKKNNIPYWLDSGTLLGAVRHNGFIPWDDDVDIGMMREDIHRFIDAVEKENHPNFIVQTKKNDPHFMQDWPVVRDLQSEYIQSTVLHNIRKYKGLQLDIFPFEKGIIKSFEFLGNTFACKKNEKIEKKQLRTAHFIDFFCDYFIFPFWRFLGLFCSRRKKLSLGYGCFFSYSLNYETIFPLKPINFEGFSFSAPNNVDKYLSNCYGPTYMEIPPEDKRIVHTSEIRMYF